MRRRQVLAGLGGSLLAAPALALSPKRKRLLGSAALGPSLDLSFFNTGALDGRFTFTRAGNGWAYAPIGTLTQYATNVPRFDYDPVTLASLGWLIEEQRTNSIRNPRAEGAVVGTPGTLPTNWSVTAAAGLTTNVIATGTESGVPYVELQVTGTSNATVWALVFEAPSVVAAAQNQVWSSSGYVRVSNGSLSNVTNMSVGFAELNSGGTFLVNDRGSTFTPTVSGLAGQRYSSTITVAQATAAFIRPSLFVNVSNTAAINITLRIGAPQLELGASLTSVIFPPAGTPATSTRAAEPDSLPLSAWFNPIAGTFASQAMFPQASNANDAYVFRASDGTTNNRIDLYRAAGTNTLKALVVIGGVTVVNAATVGTIVPGTSFKAALSYSSAGVSAAFNGGAPTSLTASAVSAAAFTTMSVGSTGAGGYTDGYSQRDRYWPRVLSGAEFQQVTT